MKRELVSREAEFTVVGTLLSLDSGDQDELVGEMVGVRLVDDNCQTLLNAVVSLRQSGQPADPVSVLTHLRSVGAAGGLTAADLARYTDYATGPQTVSSLLERLRELTLLRTLRSGFSSLLEAVEAPDGPSAREIADGALALATDGAVHGKDSSREAQSVILDAWNAAEEMRQASGGMVGIRTGIPLLDHLLRGLKSGQMWVVAARPGVGKTSLGLQIALQAASAGHPSLLFSLEMSSTELGIRLLSNVSGVEITGGMTDAEQHAVALAAKRISSLPIVIDDVPGGLGAAELRSRTRRAVHRRGVELVVVDYLQLMHTADRKNSTRDREVAELSRAVKIMARELGVCVILISQLNRGLEHRANGEPMLSDLRDSGAIEQDADGVLMLWVPQQDQRSNVSLKVAKNRHGGTGIVPLHWDAKATRFEPIAAPSTYSTTIRHDSKGGYRDRD